MRNKDITEKLNMSVLLDKRQNTSINKIFDQRPTSVNITRLPKNNNISRNNQDYPIIFQQNSFIIETSPTYKFNKNKQATSNIDKV